MHYSDVFAPDPDTFRPERWIDSSKEQLVQMNKAWLPVRFPLNDSLLNSLLTMSSSAPALATAKDSTLP
jgi:cytochrome P450